MRRLIRFTRRRLAIYLLLVLCFCIVLLMRYIAWERHEAALEHAAFLEKYTSLEEGMTEEEVAKLLGPHTPDPLCEWPGGSLGEHRCFWCQGQDTICVVFCWSMSAKRFDWGIVEKGFGTNNKEIQRTRYGRLRE
jgi:hypothetical protein